MRSSCAFSRRGRTILISIIFSGLLGLTTSALADEPSGTEAADATVHFSPGIADVVRMVEAKVDPTVIRTYIKNSKIRYNPTAEEIIILKQKGVPDDVLTALIEKGGEARVQPGPASPGTPPPSTSMSGYDYGPYPYPDWNYSSYPYVFNGYYPYYGSYPYNYSYWYGYPWWGFYSPFYFDGFGFHRFHHFDHDRFGHFGGFDHFDRFGRFGGRGFNGFNQGFAGRSTSPWAPAGSFRGGTFAARSAPWSPAHSFAGRPGGFAMRNGGFGGARFGAGGFVGHMGGGGHFSGAGHR